MSNDPVGDFRRLPPIELRKKLQELNQFCLGAPTELAEFACGLFGHMRKLADDTFAYVEDMEKEIEGLPQHHSGKRTLLAEIRRLPFVGPGVEEKIRDRINRATVQKPPEPEKKKALKSVTQGGREWTFPEGLEP